MEAAGACRRPSSDGRARAKLRADHPGPRVRCRCHAFGGAAAVASDETWQLRLTRAGEATLGERRQSLWLMPTDSSTMLTRVIVEEGVTCNRSVVDDDLHG